MAIRKALMAFPRKSFLVTPLTSPEHTLETKVKISVLNLSSKKKKKRCQNTRYDSTPSQGSQVLQTAWKLMACFFFFFFLECWFTGANPRDLMQKKSNTHQCTKSFRGKHLGNRTGVTSCRKHEGRQEFHSGDSRRQNDTLQTWGPMWQRMAHACKSCWPGWSSVVGIFFGPSTSTKIKMQRRIINYNCSASAWTYFS